MTTASPRVCRPETAVAIAALVAGLTLGGLILAGTMPSRLGLFLVGGGLGIALYHGAFGFTGGWRHFVLQRRADGLRAQFALLAVTMTLMVPVLALAQGSGMTGAVAPLGVSLIVGAFLFGAGMQFGGGCGSGTLFTVGAGNLRMLVTLAFFIAGSVVGTVHLPWWLRQPRLDPLDLAASLTVPGALVLQLAACGALALWVTRIERNHHGNIERPVLAMPAGGFGRALISGPWPLIWAVIALALGNLAVLLLSGRPWGITFAFALWGAKIMQAIGIDPTQFEYWTWRYPAAALNRSVLFDATSVTNFGLLIGSMGAAAMAGRFGHAARARIPLRALMSAAFGGLLMGYGARLAFGCNIGAMFSGIASASLHGWVWFAAAWIGSYAAIQLRRPGYSGTG